MKEKDNTRSNIITITLNDGDIISIDKPDKIKVIARNYVLSSQLDNEDAKVKEDDLGDTFIETVW